MVNQLIDKIIDSTGGLSPDKATSIYIQINVYILLYTVSIIFLDLFLGKLN